MPTSTKCRRSALSSLSLLHRPYQRLRYTRGLGWRMHCGAEVTEARTESSTNTQHHLSQTTAWHQRITRKNGPPKTGPQAPLAPILWSQRKHAYERKLACAGSALCARGRRVGIRGCKGKWETHTPMVARFPQYTIYLNQICAFRGLLNGSFLENLM